MVEDIEAHRRVVNSSEFIELATEERDAVVGILRGENNVRTSIKLNIDIEKAKETLRKVEDESYSLSFAMQKMLFENGAVLGADSGATTIYVHNFFAQHNLDYPMTWSMISSSGPQGITYRQDTAEEIGAKTSILLEQIDRGSSQNQFDSFTRERLKKAADFMQTYRTNLSRYYDGYYMKK